jgi:malate synthase
VLPGTGVEPAAFWAGFDAIVRDLAPKNAACWPSATACRPRSTPGTAPTPGRSPTCRLPRLPEKIGYLVPVPAQVKATTANVDAELACRPGRNWWCPSSTPAMR